MRNDVSSNSKPLKQNNTNVTRTKWMWDGDKQVEYRGGEQRCGRAWKRSNIRLHLTLRGCFLSSFCGWWWTHSIADSISLEIDAELLQFFLQITHRWLARCRFWKRGLDDRSNGYLNGIILRHSFVGEFSTVGWSLAARGRFSCRRNCSVFLVSTRSRNTFS